MKAIATNNIGNSIKSFIKNPTPIPVKNAKNKGKPAQHKAVKDPAIPANTPFILMYMLGVNNIKTLVN